MKTEKRRQKNLQLFFCLQCPLAYDESFVDVMNSQDKQSGTCPLKKILLPVDSDPDPSPAVEVTADLIRGLSTGACEVRLLHVGDSAAQPAIQLPAEDKAKWRRSNRLGSPVTAIREEAEQEAVDLIVMTTSGRHGFFDAVRGSTTEQVVEHARCPVLAVHASSD